MAAYIHDHYWNGTHSSFDTTEMFEYTYNHYSGQHYFRSPNSRKWQTYTPVTVYKEDMPVTMYKEDMPKQPVLSFSKSACKVFPPVQEPLVENPPINYQQSRVDRHAGGWQKNTNHEWSGHNFCK